MVERRSMGDAFALDPEKLAFIHGENVATETGRGPEKPRVPDRSPEAPESVRQESRRSGPRIRRPGRRPKAASPAPIAEPQITEDEYSTELPPFRISMTTRLSPATSEAL